MIRKPPRRSENIYSFILNFYPKSYREDFGEEMKFVFSESLRDANSRDGEGIVNLWTRTIIDSGKSILKENLENRKGGEFMKGKKDIVMQNKIFAWIAAGTLALLSIPYLGMKLQLVKPDPSNPADMGINWTLFDFLVMGVLLFGAGSIFVLVARATPRKYRLLVGLAVLGIFFVTWVHLAVGIVDTWPFAGS